MRTQAVVLLFVVCLHCVLSEDDGCPPRPPQCTKSCPKWSSDSQCGPDRKCSPNFACCEIIDCCFRACITQLNEEGGEGGDLTYDTGKDSE